MYLLGLPIETSTMVTLQLFKLRRSAEILHRAFLLFDTENTGLIHQNDFHGVLNYFIMPLSSGLFTQLMDSLNVLRPPNKKINWHDFITSHCQTEPLLARLDTRELLRLEKCLGVIDRIKHHVACPAARLKKVFTNVDKEGRKEVTRPELRRAVEQGLDFTLADDEFKELCIILDPLHTNLIKCDEFVQLFDSDILSVVRMKQEGKPVAYEFGLIPNVEAPDSNLRGRKLKSKLRMQLNKNMKNVEKALLMCDLDQSGLIQPQQLRQILENFCFALTDDQFNEIMGNFRIFRDRTNYYEFLELYRKKPHEDTEKWIKLVTKLVPFKSKDPVTLSLQETEELLREAVRARYKKMLKDFAILDICKVGIAYKNDVRRLFNKYALRMNDYQFNTLWKKFPKNRFGQLKYKEFLEEFSNLSCPEGVAPNTPSSDSGYSFDTDDVQPPVYKSSTQDECQEEDLTWSKNETPEEVHLRRRREDLDEAAQDRRPNRIVSTPRKKYPPSGNEKVKHLILQEAPQLMKAFSSIKMPILKHMREIRHRFRRMDPKMTGMVDFYNFQSILRESGVYFTDEEIFHLLEYFDPSLTGIINYKDFLKAFIWYA